MSNNIKNQKDANYYRYIFQKCAESEKLIVITGIYEGSCKSDKKNRVTFSSIYPYISEKDYVLTELTDHINLNRDDCNKAIELSHSTLEMGKKYILVGKSYIYINKNNEIKGGILLVNDLKNYGLYGINDFSTKYYNNIPNNLVIDFRKEFMGLFAWDKRTIVKNQSIVKEENIGNVNLIYNTSFTFTENLNINKKNKNSITILNNNEEENIYSNTLDSRLDDYSQGLSDNLLKNRILNISSNILKIKIPKSITRIHTKKSKKKKD